MDKAHKEIRLGICWKIKYCLEELGVPRPLPSEGGVLEIGGADGSSEGQYTCTLTNGIGQALSKTISIDVKSKFPVEIMPWSLWVGTEIKISEIGYFDISIWSYHISCNNLQNLTFVYSSEINSLHSITQIWYPTLHVGQGVPIFLEGVLYILFELTLTFAHNSQRDSWGDMEKEWELICTVHVGLKPFLC